MSFEGFHFKIEWWHLVQCFQRNPCKAKKKWGSSIGLLISHFLTVGELLGSINCTVIKQTWPIIQWRQVKARCPLQTSKATNLWLCLWRSIWQLQCQALQSMWTKCTRTQNWRHNCTCSCFLSWRSYFLKWMVDPTVPRPIPDIKPNEWEKVSHMVRIGSEFW